MNRDELSLRIKSILVRELDLSVIPMQIGDNEPLYSSFIRLDSLSLLRMILALEREFQIEIDDEDVMEANLETVQSLIELISKAISTKQ